MKESGTRAFDLTSFADDLTARSLAPELVTAISRATSVGSAYQDLCAARDAVEVLRGRIANEKAGQIVDAERGVIGAALFAHAVLLYARSTDTKPIDRQKWFGEQQLTKSERIWHKEVMEYRDKVLAHFGRGALHSAGPTINHTLVLVMPPEMEKGLEINYIEIRANTKSELFSNVYNLTNKCLLLCRKKYDQRIEEVNKHLKQLIQSDPDSAKLSLNFPFSYDKIHEAVKSSTFNPSGHKTLHYAARKQPQNQSE